MKATGGGGAGKAKEKVRGLTERLQEVLRLLAPGEVWDSGDNTRAGERLFECHERLQQMDEMRRKEGMSDFMSDLLPMQGREGGDDDMVALEAWVSQSDLVIEGSRLENLRKYRESNDIHTPTSKIAVQSTVTNDIGYSKGNAYAFM